MLFIVTLFFVPDPGKRALDGLIGGVAVGGGVLLLALLMEKLLRRDAMGGGDIKLLFLTGLFLGWQKNLLCLLLACVVGILWGLVRAKRGQQGLPWGPGIALAAGCAALFGQNRIDGDRSLLLRVPSIDKGKHACQRVFPLLFALFALAGVSLAPKERRSAASARICRLRPPASQKLKIIRKYIAGRCGAVLPEQKWVQTRKDP